MTRAHPGQHMIQRRRLWTLRGCRWFVPWFAVALAGIAPQGQSRALPFLRQHGSATQLVVDGRPFLIRGGELGNPTASNLEYLAPHWTRFRELRLNTILAPVYWDLLEPEAPHLLDVWRAGAPAIDFIAPDIYFPNFVESSSVLFLA